jgi:hypothetical protein
MEDWEKERRVERGKFIGMRNGSGSRLSGQRGREK